MRNVYKISSMVTFCLLCAIFSSIMISSQAHAENDWTCWRGSAYDGISRETGWNSDWSQKKPEIIWNASVGTGFSSMTISKGLLYTMGNTGKKDDKKEKEHKDIVYCLNADTGEEIWRHSYLCPLDPKYYEGGPGASPTFDGDVVYTLSKDGDLFCFEAKNGEIVWKKDISENPGMARPTWGFSCSPLVKGKLLILNAGTSGLALNKETGTVIWHNGKEAAGYATPVPFKMNDREALAIFAGKAIVALDPESGRILWQFPWETHRGINAADPIISGNDVFISSGYNYGCARLNIKDGKATEIWRNKNMRNHFNSSVLWNGYIYGFDESQLKCLDFKDGSVKWGQKGLGKGSLMIADGKLLILSEKGQLVLAEINPNEFKEISKAQILQGLCWTVPVLAGGKIYARNAKGDLVCIDVSI